MSFDLNQLGTDATALETEGNSGGITREPPQEGPALFRLVSVLELGANAGEYQGKPKVNQPVILEFELMMPHHAVRKEDGEFLFNPTVTVRLPTKSNSGKSKYMELFSQLNYDGAVPVTKGKVPSFAPFLGKAFFGEIFNNVTDTGTYTNIDKDGVYKIGAPRVPEIDQTTQVPTGNFKDIDVPMHTSPLRCFLWETNVSDEVYTNMWNSLSKDDGAMSWIQEAILRRVDDGKKKANIALEGSRAERLFDSNAAELDAAIAPEVPADPLAAAQAPAAPAAAPAGDPVPATPAPTADVAAAPAAPTTGAPDAHTIDPSADPLAGIPVG